MEDPFKPSNILLISSSDQDRGDDTADNEAKDSSQQIYHNDTNIAKGTTDPGVDCFDQ